MLASIPIPSWGSKSRPTPDRGPVVRHPCSHMVGCHFLAHEGLMVFLVLVPGSG